MDAEEIERRFDELVAFCKRLQDDKRLHAGFTFVIRDGIIQLESLQPSGPGHETFDLEGTSIELRSNIQEVRHALARWFDMEADAWNASSIGRMLNDAEKKFREQTYHIEAGTPHNIFVMLSALESMVGLVLLVTSPKFKGKWKWRKFAVLNRFAKEVFARNKKRSALQTMSMSAELVLAVDELRRQPEHDVESMRGFITSLLRTDILNELKTFFGYDDNQT